MLGTSHVAVVTTSIYYLQHWDPYRHSRNGWYIVSTIAANEGFDNCTRQGRYVSSSSLLDLAKWISTKVDLLLLCSSRSLFRKKMYYTLRTSTTNIWILNLYPFCHTVNDSHLRAHLKKVMMREKRSKLYIYISTFFLSQTPEKQSWELLLLLLLWQPPNAAQLKNAVVWFDNDTFSSEMIMIDLTYQTENSLKCVYGGSSFHVIPLYIIWVDVYKEIENIKAKILV